jgi:Ca2+-transporting ATPase
MFQRLLLTVSLTGAQWAVVLAVSVAAPLLVFVDKIVQLQRSSDPVGAAS